MNIGAMIKKLRNERDLTQEQLAEYLNISVSAVSQWESEKTVPDISTILALAEFFNVSLDDLFDRNSEKRKADIDNYDKKSLEYRNKGEIQQDLSLWKEAVQKYPNDFNCLESLAYALFSNCEDKENIRSCISICERILRDCKENIIKSSAIQLLVMIYSQKHWGFADEEKAVMYANMATDLYVSKQILLSYAYFTEESKQKRLEVKHQNILQYTDLLCSGLQSGKYDSEEDKIKSLNAAITIWKTLIYDDNFLFYSCRMNSLYVTLAFSYAKLKNREETLSALKNAFYYAEKYDSQPIGKQHFTSIFINYACSDSSRSTTNTTKSNKEIMREYMGFNEFDFLREDDEFIEMCKI